MPFRSAALVRLVLGVVCIAAGVTPLAAQNASQPPAAAPSASSAAPAAQTDAPPAPIGTLPDGWTRRGDTGVTALPGGKFAFGMQYRLVYNASNLPGPGRTTFTDTAGYDFFRQRVRLNLEAAPNDHVGAFVQAEFRGGWGGSAPAVSDPRGIEPTRNPFNFLDDRGLRYTSLYWKPSKQQQVMAGILPLSDEFGDTLFSADWDWNVGGVSWLGASGGSRWRVAALNLVDGIGSSDPDTIAHNGTLLIGDYARRAERPSASGEWAIDWGAHVYALIVQENLPLGGTRDVWLGPTVTLRNDDLAVNLFAILNTGDLGVGTLASNGTVISGFTNDDARGHTGIALRAEAETGLWRGRLKGQVLYATGDRDGEVDRRVTTPMNLFGASGYWGYTHIFTANGPSDVNDLGLDIGNGGAGLFTAQVLGRMPLTERVGLDLSAGWFRADEARNAGRDMGYELGGALRVNLSRPLTLDAGLATAKLGDFFGRDADRIHEVFCRLQLQY
jgi:hypothetical protein